MLKSPLAEFGRNVYSQAGEDGILEEVFLRLAITSGTYVDLGAFDGLYMSNVECLRQRGWTGVSVECDHARHTLLLKHLEQYPGNAAMDTEVNLDNMRDLTDWGVTLVDFDIDGLDLRFWREIPDCPAPLFVLIEVEPADALGVRREHSDEQWLSAGIRCSSFSSVVDEAIAKGYKLVAYTGLNCLFAQDRVAWEIIEPIEPDMLYMNGNDRQRYRQQVTSRSTTT